MDKTEYDLSRVAEGTGPVKPGNLPLARCYILRENPRDKAFAASGIA